MGIAMPDKDQILPPFDNTPPFVVADICDWISVSQNHNSLPKQPSKTHYLIVDTDTGEVTEKKHNAVFVEGSFSTHIRVQVNGGRVSMSGNIGRFGRPENVFGHSLDKVKQQTNQLCTLLELPPFSSGMFHRIQSKGESSTSYTGAKISRIDICTNYSAGKHAHAVIGELSKHHISRTKSKTYGDSETVQWGNSLKTTKCYNKATELRRHDKSKLVYIRELANWCEEIGLVRHETKFTEKYLNRNGLKPWCRCTSETIKSHYEETKEILKTTMELDDTVNMPSHLLGTYHAYINGMNMNRLSKSTFYRHRKELTRYGIDIAIPNNVRQLKPKTLHITLSESTIPQFYNKVANE